MLQTAEGLTAIILRLGGAGGGLRARLSPFPYTEPISEARPGAKPVTMIDLECGAVGRGEVV